MSERYIITARKNGQPMSYYVGRSGIVTTMAANAAISKTIDEALDELEYLRKASPEYRFAIERLPQRMSVSKAVLYAVPVE